jgi:hypothetical protein
MFFLSFSIKISLRADKFACLNFVEILFKILYTIIDFFLSTKKFILILHEIDGLCLFGEKSFYVLIFSIDPLII